MSLTSDEHEDVGGETGPAAKRDPLVQPGRAPGAAAGDRPRQHVHWITSQVRGARILNIGTNSGLVPLMLGREGFDVVGIDLQPDAHMQAAAVLAQEAETVRARVEFWNLDRFQNGGNAAFDTVVLSEVIEYVSNAEKFVQMAIQHLKEGGTLLIVTPFGPSADGSLKHSFYLSDIRDLLAPRGRIEHLAVADGLIRTTLHRIRTPRWGDTIKGNALLRAETLLATTEGAAREAQNLLHLQLDAIGRESARQKSEIAALKQAALEAGSNLRQKEDALAVALQNLAKMRERLSVTEKSLAAASKTAASHRDMLDSRDNELRDARRDIAVGHARHDALQEELLAAERELSPMRGRLSALETMLTSRDADHDRLKRDLEQSRTRLAEAEKRELDQSGVLEMIQAELAQTKKHLAASGAELVTTNTIVAQQKAAALAQAQALEEMQVRERASAANAVGLKSKIDAAHAKDRQLMQQMVKLLTENRNRLEVYQNRQLRWIPPLVGLIEALSLDPSAVAATSIKLAKERFADEDFATLLLASLTQALEPRPHREKWMGFSLLKNGLADAAREVLVPLSGKVSFSPSEQRQFGILTARDQQPKDETPVAGPPRRRRALPKKRLFELRVACVMDEFTHASFDPECKLLALTPEGWQSEIATFAPDLLFIESAWHGKNGRWNKKISHPSQEIRDLIAWCRARGIPSIFWNKEDPVHFSVFLPLAALVDAVFTTDADRVPAYKHALGHGQVFLLPFAAQPREHNPIEKYERRDAFNFAGSYYLRYPERQRNFAALVDTLKEIRPVDIYDRNHGKPHPDYKFPEAYAPLILGSLPFAEIDKAYKGYRFGINMNTIKQSQTMFARRVFELLASNTVVVSNFSRGIRLLFGDLVISSDHGPQIGALAGQLAADEVHYRKLRLLGLRKVMSEHTYRHRLHFIASKLFEDVPQTAIPRIAILASADNAAEHDAIITAFARQTHSRRALFLASRHGGDNGHAGIAVLPDPESCVLAFERERDRFDYLGLFSATDHYGENYLTDLALGPAYADAQGFGKAAHYAMAEDSPELRNSTTAYRPAPSLMLRSAIIKITHVDGTMLRNWLTAPDHALTHQPGLIALDEFNYCRDGANASAAALALTEDLKLTNRGCGLDTIHATIDKMPAHGLRSSSADEQLQQFDAARLGAMFLSAPSDSVKLTIAGDALLARSTLRPEVRQYIWAKQKLRRDEINLVRSSTIKLNLEVKMNFCFVCEYYDKDDKKLSHTMLRNAGAHALAIPDACERVRFGLRFEGPGEAMLRRVVFAGDSYYPPAVIAKSRYLVLAKQYPGYDDLYRYSFLHSRVRSYRRVGVEVDVFKLRSHNFLSFDEFENVDVAIGDLELLDKTLGTNRYSHILVHFLDNKIWTILKKYSNNSKIIIWIHGAEIQTWKRRTFEFERMTQDEIMRQKKLSEQRVNLWNDVFSKNYKKLHFVFVSNYLFNEIKDDLNFSLDTRRYSIIHNHIDDYIFQYQEKTPVDRRKILSVRPYASRKYANDLSVEAIIELSNRPIFKDLSFHMVGDGELFENLTAPLQKFSNVILEKRFLTHEELQAYHRGYGIFLTPTRMDTQGVSRDEAMASGLVPITTNVTAIPEFVDAESGIIVPPENPIAIADAIEYLYMHPEKFLSLSKGAADRVRRQSGFEQTIARELELLK